MRERKGGKEEGEGEKGRKKEGRREGKGGGKKGRRLLKTKSYTDIDLHFFFLYNS